VCVANGAFVRGLPQRPAAKFQNGDSPEVRTSSRTRVPIWVLLVVAIIAHDGVVFVMVLFDDTS
jgi:hypothetical protein